MILLQKQMAKPQKLQRRTEYFRSEGSMRLNPTQAEKAGQEKIELTDHEKKAIRDAQSKDAGMHIYVMTVHYPERLSC